MCIYSPITLNEPYDHRRPPEIGPLPVFAAVSGQPTGGLGLYGPLRWLWSAVRLYEPNLSETHAPEPFRHTCSQDQLR